LKAKPGELTTIPVDIGGKTVNIPFATSGEFGIVGGEKISYTKEGLKLNEPFFIYGKGTGEESFLFMRMPKETQKLSAPRYDFLNLVDAKISYQKIFEQAMGGTPKAVLYTEEMEKALGFSSAPRIPVLIKYVSHVEDYVPLLKMPYLHPPTARAGLFNVEEFGKEKRTGGTHIEPRIPVAEDYRPDIGAKSVPPAFTPPAVFQPISQMIGDVTAVAPRIGEIAVPKVTQTAQPKIGEITVPKIGETAVPKLEPKINIPDYKPPPGETLPKMPALPPISLGIRDIPIASPMRLYGRKEWLVSWFGPGAPMPLSTRNMKTGKARRGGRRK
jgi:hypothetical protein